MTEGYNGDIEFVDVTGFIKVGTFPDESDTAMTTSEVNDICGEINSDVNIVLKELGFRLPITDADSVQWLALTKKFGAASLVLDGMMAQDVGEDNERAERYWQKYLQRMKRLIDSGGEFIEGNKEGVTGVNYGPTLVGAATERGQKRFLRFPQRAAADQFTNDRELGRVNADWAGAARGH